MGVNYKYLFCSMSYKFMLFIFTAQIVLALLWELFQLASLDMSSSCLFFPHPLLSIFLFFLFLFSFPCFAFPFLQDSQAHSVFSLPQAWKEPFVQGALSGSFHWRIFRNQDLSASVFIATGVTLLWGP